MSTENTHKFMEKKNDMEERLQWWSGDITKTTEALGGIFNSVFKSKVGLFMVSWFPGNKCHKIQETNTKICTANGNDDKWN